MAKRTKKTSDSNSATPQRAAAISADQQELARDRALYVAALQALQRGEQPTREQIRGRKRYEQREEEEARWRFYGSIPQKHWRAMSGRSTKVLNEQAERYGIPFGGAAIDLAAVVKSLHDFLAKNAVKLARGDDGDSLMLGPDSPALERYRDERAKLAKLERLEREESLLPRDEVHESFGLIAHILRQAGEILFKEYGADAQQILNDAIDDAQREMNRKLGGEDDETIETKPSRKRR